jgi:hypothetical protein
VVRIARHAGGVPRSCIHKDCHSDSVNDAVVIAIRQPIAWRIVR